MSFEFEMGCIAPKIHAIIQNSLVMHFVHFYHGSHWYNGFYVNFLLLIFDTFVAKITPHPPQDYSTYMQLLNIEVFIYFFEEPLTTDKNCGITREG